MARKQTDASARVLKIIENNPHWSTRKVADVTGYHYMWVSVIRSKFGAPPLSRDELEWVIDAVRGGLNVEDALATVWEADIHDKTVMRLAEKGENGLAIVNDFEFRKSTEAQRRIVVVAVPVTPQDRD